MAPATIPEELAGKPTDCVHVGNISEARVISDQVIDFHMNGGSVLRNTLPQSCPQLGLEKAFTYSTATDRLCNAQIITVIRQSNGVTRGASCSLGRFEPAAAPTR